MQPAAACLCCWLLATCMLHAAANRRGACPANSDLISLQIALQLGACLGCCLPCTVSCKWPNLLPLVQINSLDLETLGGDLRDHASIGCGKGKRHNF